MKRKEVLSLIGYTPNDNGDYKKGNKIIKSKAIINDNLSNWKNNFSQDDKFNFIQNAVNQNMKYEEIERICSNNFRGLDQFDRLFRNAFNNKINKS